MPIAGVVIDNWKLLVFRKALDAHGFKYTEHDGPGKHCITLKVETPTIGELYPVVERAHASAQRNKKRH